MEHSCDNGRIYCRLKENSSPQAAQQQQAVKTTTTTAAVPTGESRKANRWGAQSSTATSTAAGAPGTTPVGGTYRSNANLNLANAAKPGAAEQQQQQQQKGLNTAPANRFGQQRSGNSPRWESSNTSSQQQQSTQSSANILGRHFYLIFSYGPLSKPSYFFQSRLEFSRINIQNISPN